MKRVQVTQFIIAGLIILILLIQRNVNADKKGCEKATDLAEQGAKNNIQGYSKTIKEDIVRSQTIDFEGFLRLIESKDKQEITNRLEKARTILIKDKVYSKNILINCIWRKYISVI